MVPQSFPGKKFHGDEVLPVRFANLINRADVRVIQRRNCARFAPKTLHRLAFAGRMFVQKFQRDDSAQRQILSLEDIAHASAADLFQHAIVRDCASGWLTHGEALNRSRRLSHRYLRIVPRLSSRRWRSSHPRARVLPSPADRGNLTLRNAPSRLVTHARAREETHFSDTRSASTRICTLRSARLPASRQFQRLQTPRRRPRSQSLLS